ncbi:MAG: flagellar basal body P-ring protein FlgI, partial [Planctomycetota bacterium]
GSFTNIFLPESMPVQGYGLVGGLNGTGSPECPSNIRAYLRHYVLALLPAAEPKVNIDELINDKNTAVVAVRGLMLPEGRGEEGFDVRVEALSGTQTSSLEGGWLYKAELKRTGVFSSGSRVLARVEGPVFTDKITSSETDRRVGYILAGGKVRDKYGINMELRQPNYLVSRRISDVLNTRFGEGTAKAVSPGVVRLNPPLEYSERRQKFVSLVKSMYLGGTAEVTEKRIDDLVAKLARSQEKATSEAALEAIGNESLKKLAPLLDSLDEEVRLRAARCMLNLGSEKGLETLWETAMRKSSPYRVEALEAVTAGADRKEAARIARRLLRDDDFNVRLAAYGQLQKLDDIVIRRSSIAGTFYLEEITQMGKKEIFAYRSGQPRIVLFGAPIKCRDDVFVESADGSITIDARRGREYVSVMRKVPNLPRVVPLKSSFEVSDIIRTLCEEPIVEEGSAKRPGLNVPYADAIAMLKQMCDKGAVDAEFRAGPLPKID